ncbi:MAG: hypothetical protein A2096_07755 [Spirochaetes bacterium GWF1_41_5]|nr:MAG: hypothetical protein A2096_07755 [Spirochaetes bacterium GWF1_41_5]HBE02990.1 hypothetical protein [Spirochaetia bacterium]
MYADHNSCLFFSAVASVTMDESATGKKTRQAIAGQLESFLGRYFLSAGFDQASLQSGQFRDMESSLLYYLNETMTNAIKAQQIDYLARTHRPSLDLEQPSDREQALSLFEKYKQEHNGFLRKQSENSPIRLINQALERTGKIPCLCMFQHKKNRSLVFTVYNFTGLRKIDEKRYCERAAMALKKNTDHSYTYHPATIVFDSGGGGANFGIYSSLQSLDSIFNINPRQTGLREIKNGRKTAVAAGLVIFARQADSALGKKDLH